MNDWVKNFFAIIDFSLKYRNAIILILNNCHYTLVILLKIFIYYLMYLLINVYVYDYFAYVYVCVPYVCILPRDFRRGH